MRRPNAVQTLALGFALLILTGACLLSLPIASRSGEGIPWTSAVFTAGIYHFSKALSRTWESYFLEPPAR